MLAGAGGQAVAWGKPRHPRAVRSSGPRLVHAAQQSYQNPLRLIRRLHAKRIDEGVDYSGAGPVKSLGNATIVTVDRGTSYFWGNVDGNVVVEKMLDGPLQGINIYVAENCIPNPNLQVGEQVTAATTLCRLHNHFPWLEIGFAKRDASGIPAAWPVYRRFPDGSKTAYGLDFSHLLGDLGAPQGNTNHGSTDVSYRPWKKIGKLPRRFPRF
ncbi:MAG: hypothetical protein JOZ73_09325 [Solirubrobacterales bacterium]|nr:hypothetical protein [Solirubrobacterales bacterium]